MVYIYTLSCPITDEVKYVGRSKNPKKRYYAHIDKKSKKCKKSSWIKGLINSNMRPVLHVIDEAGDDWAFWEEYYISQFKAWGFSLKNMTNGGDGSSVSSMLIGKKRPKHVCDKISKSKKESGFRHSEKTKQAIRDFRRGNTLSDETKQKLSKSQKRAWSLISNSERSKRALIGAKKRMKSVVCVKDGAVLGVFDSARIAAIETGSCYKKISAVCNGIRKSHNGCVWYFQNIK